MKTRGSLFSGVGGRWFLVAALAVIVAGAAAPGAVAQDLMHARVSFDSGGAMVKGSEDEDWSYATTNTLVLPGDTLWVDEEGTLEVEMSGGTFLRMADGSKADIVSLPPSGVIKGWTGSFYVQRIARSTGSVIFQTPVADMHIQNDTQARIDILGNGATTVSVRWGVVTISSPGAADTVVTTGQRSYIDPGYLPSEPEPFDRGVEDSFDAWNRERARLLAVGYDEVPSTVIKEAPVGVSDLAAYGDWITIDNDYYWRPTVVTDYVPYRYGHWSFAPSIGYSWVGDYPFCYITSHYGRWRHHPRYGWAWRYRPVWSPAWVASVRYGPNFVWSPLDPWDRPVVFGHDYYYVGGLQFSVMATSYVGADYLLYGGRYINRFTPSITYGIPTSQINIWNININTRRPHYRWPDSSIRIRDYAPRRVIRGPVALDHEGTLARARVTNLERAVGRQRFEPDRARVRRSVRTSARASTREARARSVRLRPEASAATPQVRGRQLATRDIGGIRDRGRSTRSIRDGSSAPSAGISPRSTITPSRERTTTRDRSIRGAPETPRRSGVPTERSPGSRERSIRSPEVPTIRGRSSRSAPSPSVRTPSRSAPSPSVRTPSRSTPSPSVRTPSRSTPSPSVRTPTRSTPSPSVRTPSRSTPSPSVRTPSRSTPSPSVRTPSRSTPSPSVRTPSRSAPSRSRSSLRTLPRSTIVGRSSPSRTSVRPHAQAPSPTFRSAPRPSRSAPSPSRSVPSPSRRSITSSPRISAPQPSRPSIRPSTPSPSPRVSAPSRSFSRPSSPSISRGSSGISRGSSRSISRGSSRGGSSRGRR